MSADLKLVQLLDRDDVAIYNSIPTVEGALMMAIENTQLHSAWIQLYCPWAWAG